MNQPQASCELTNAKPFQRIDSEANLIEQKVFSIICVLLVAVITGYFSLSVIACPHAGYVFKLWFCSLL